MMDTPAAENAEVTPDVFRPSLGRALFAAVIAFGAFFIPQEIPLEYYPLNDPSSGLQYFEITCGANFTGNVRVLLNTGRGFNDLEKIEWPIGPSEMAFTYTFPLADAPLQEIHFLPIERGPGELTITNCRIINRREEEIYRFPRERFIPVQDITSIETLPNGFKIVTTEKDHNPRLRLALAYPVPAEGMNLRNLQRSLLSTGYLAMMLWIILLAVFFAFRRPEPWRLTVQRMAFLALLGVFFSFVGNRGLIRNTIRFARFEAPWRLEFDVKPPPSAGAAQIYWDSGSGYSEAESAHDYYLGGSATQALAFALPPVPLHALRFDPVREPSSVTLERIRLVDGSGATRASLPLTSLQPIQQIARIDRRETPEGPAAIVIETDRAANDPILEFSPEALKTLNDARGLAVP